MPKSKSISISISILISISIFLICIYTYACSKRVGFLGPRAWGLASEVRSRPTSKATKALWLEGGTAALLHGYKFGVSEN